MALADRGRPDREAGSRPRNGTMTFIERHRAVAVRPVLRRPGSRGVSGRPRKRRGGDWRRVEQLPRDGLPGLCGDIAREGTEVDVERHERHGVAKRSRVAQEAPVHDTPEVAPRLAREPQPGDHHIYALRRQCRGRAEALVCPEYDFSRAWTRERGRASRLLVEAAR